MIANKKIILLILAFILVLTVFISFFFGSKAISINEFLSALGNENSVIRTVLFEIRLPRILNAAVTGAGLACSGLVLQSLLKNNLAEPGLLGISSGAGLGAILIFLISSSAQFYLVTPVSFIFALITTFLIFTTARGIKYKYTNFISSNKIILTGIALSAFISSVNAFLLLSSGTGVTQIIFWLSGGFSGRGWHEFYLSFPFTLIGIAGAMLISKELNLLSLGEELAQPLGLNIKLFQKVAVFISALLAAAAVSVAGIISFVGLIVPNIARLLMGTNHRYTIPASILIGSIMLITADLISRVIIAPSEIPAGIIISFIGAPVFFWLIVKKDKIK